MSATYPLAAALEYRNDDVVNSFLATYAMSRDEAELLFEDVRRWMWLCTKAKASQTLMFIDPKMKLFDEMWHTFVLFTIDYAAFCSEYLGEFCHHEPMRQRQRDEFEQRKASDPDSIVREVREKYTALITLVARELGEDVAVRWFDTYRHRHTEEYMRSIHKYGSSPAPPVHVR